MRARGFGIQEPWTTSAWWPTGVLGSRVETNLTRWLAAVWIVGPNSEVSLKPVTVVRYEIDRVVVGEGLNKGDIVVTAGVNRLHDRQKVRLQEGVSE